MHEIKFKNACILPNQQTEKHNLPKVLECKDAALLIV